MLIAIDFKNGRVKEFDPGAFTNSAAMQGADPAARNALTELDLRLDLIEEVGLRIDYYWYDVAASGGEVEISDEHDDQGAPVMMPLARRKRGTSILLATPEELRDAARVVVYRANGSVQAAWRQGRGNWIILGTKFDAQRVLTYTDAKTTGLNAQAVAVFSYLRKVNPGLTDDEVSELMGYPYGALREVRGAETEQLGGFGADDGDGSGGQPARDAPEPSRASNLDEMIRSIAGDVPEGDEWIWDALGETPGGGLGDDEG